MKSQIATGRHSSTTTATCAFPEQSVPAKKSIPLSSLWPRRQLVTSLSQAVIATSLALSIITFLISLIEFLPAREATNLVKQEALQQNTFICIIVPLVLAYCSQSRVIAAFSQRWMLFRVCEVLDCYSLTNAGAKLGSALMHAAGLAGLTCLGDPFSFSDRANSVGPLHLLMQTPSSKEGESDYLHSSRLVTTSLTVNADGSTSRPKNGSLSMANVPEQLFTSLLLNNSAHPLSSKPKCLINPNFDACSTDTDTP